MVVQRPWPLVEQLTTKIVLIALELGWQTSACWLAA
jgi:hypothetical protein